MKNLNLHHINHMDHHQLSSFSEGLFGHNFPLTFDFSGHSTQVGSVTLLSSNEVIFNRIEVGLYFLIGNAMLKTAVLMILFSIAFSKLLTQPLNQLTAQIREFNLNDPEASKLHSMNYEHSELNVLEKAYNNLIDELILYKNKLNQSQRETVAANRKLDEQNLLLIQEVAKKTSSLSASMLNMERQKQSMIEQQKKLEKENDYRKNTENVLLETNKDLKNSILELNTLQGRLLEAEKMANLGSLSAEVTHEVSTPIGVSITSTSYLVDLLKKLSYEMSQQQLSKKSLGDFLTQSEQATTLLTHNLGRASELLTSYKQVAVDQLSNKVRQVNASKYMKEIIQSLQPKLKKKSLNIDITCDENLIIYVHAGALSQIMTNLIINSIHHGFDNFQAGTITISISMHNDIIKLYYHDNGQGISPDNIERLFDPFYTTKASKGGSGLGTHIIHNLVTDTLNGKIVASSYPKKGLAFDIEFTNMR